MTAMRGQHQKTVKAARFLVAEGKFEEATRELLRLPEEWSGLPSTLHQRANLALLRNNNTQAEALLRLALKSQHKHHTNQNQPASLEKQLKLDLATTLYRQKKHHQAAQLLKELISHLPSCYTKSLNHNAQLWSHFEDQEAYEVTGSKRSLSQLNTDRGVPTVEVCIGDSAPQPFLLDTGTSDVVLDRQVAENLGISSDSDHYKIPSLTIGETHLGAVPCSIRSLTQKSRGNSLTNSFAGILGINALRHLNAVIDTGNQLLVTGYLPQTNLIQSTPKDDLVELPLWISGTHHMVTWGRINHSRPLMFHIDTGFSEHGFTANEKILHKTRAPLDWKHLKETPTTFPVHLMALGTGGKQLLVEDIQGALNNSRNPILEGSLGFNVAGIVSQQCFHDQVMSFDFTNMKLYLLPSPEMETSTVQEQQPKLLQMRNQAARLLGQWIPGTRAEEAV